MLACIQWPAFPSPTGVGVGLCGISVPFGTLSPALGKISYVLLTRTPRYRGRIPFAFDLHVLGPPLTFALSQDQTLQLNLGSSAEAEPPTVSETQAGSCSSHCAD